MPRIRSIKPQFFKDPDLAELPIEARLFYAGLWCQADRAGRLRDEPKLLKVEIAPYDDIDADELLKLLAKPRTTSAGETEPGFIIRYEVRGRRYIWIPRFLKHQKPHHKETDSEIPPPPGTPAESGQGRAQAGSNPVDSGFLFPDSGVLDPGQGDPPVAPRKEPGGPTGSVLPLRIAKRQRAGPTTLAEDLRLKRDAVRNERSKLLHAWIAERTRPAWDEDQQREVPQAPPVRDEQLAWVQKRCHASPEEAADVVAIVEQAQEQFRRAPS